MKVRSDIKTENEQKLFRIWKELFLLDTPLLALKFDSFSQLYFLKQ